MERYRIGPDAAVYFVTYCVVDWLPVFVSEATCRVITDSLQFCHARKGLCVNAYVIMPTHLHAMVFDREFIDGCMRNWTLAARIPQQKPASRWSACPAPDARVNNAERLQTTLTDFRKFTGRSLCDFFETHLPRCFAETFRAASTAGRKRRCWQPSRHPEAIEAERFWRQKLDYTHENPYRKGLVRRAADWRYSSAAYYVSEGQAPCDVTISPLGWSYTRVGSELNSGVGFPAE